MASSKTNRGFGPLGRAALAVLSLSYHQPAAAQDKSVSQEHFILAKFKFQDFIKKGKSIVGCTFNQDDEEFPINHATVYATPNSKIEDLMVVFQATGYTVTATFDGLQASAPRTHIDLFMQNSLPLTAPVIMAACKAKIKEAFENNL